MTQQCRNLLTSRHMRRRSRRSLARSTSTCTPPPARSAESVSGAPDPSPGFLNDLRLTLPLRPLTRAALAAVYRYGTAAERESVIQDHLEQGTLAEDPDGLLHATAPRPGPSSTACTASTPPPSSASGPTTTSPRLAALARRRAQPRPNSTYRADDPHPCRPLTSHPDSAGLRGGVRSRWWCRRHEPQDAPPGVLLFNRLAALRYHRADAHAAAWQEEGCRWPTSSP